MHIVTEQEKYQKALEVLDEKSPERRRQLIEAALVVARSVEMKEKRKNGKGGLDS
jgi:hypothetical protein